MEFGVWVYSNDLGFKELIVLKKKRKNLMGHVAVLAIITS